MDITSILELLPDSVKRDIIDFQPVKMKTGEHGTRILLDRIFTAAEKEKMSSPCIIGLDCVAAHRYAPEIKKSYFYITEG
jgi:hypothetical protein